MAAASVDLEIPAHPFAPDSDAPPRPARRRVQTIRQIVVPLDGSRFAEAALAPAAGLAARTGAALTLVHAVAPVRMPDIGAKTALDLGITDARRMLTKAMARAADAGAAVETLLVTPEVGSEPSVPAAILTAVRRLRADLVVMTTHGRSGLRRAVVGSVADAVIRHCPTPVLLVPPRCGEDQVHLAAGDQSAASACVLVALDGTPEAEAALEPAAALAAAIGGGVELLRVVPEQHLLLGPSYGLATTTRGTRDYLGRAAEALLAAHPTLRFVRAAVRTADPDRVPGTVIDHAARSEASVIALATHGRAGIARLLHRSVTAGVVANATGLVLVVPPRVTFATAKPPDPTAPKGADR